MKAITLLRELAMTESRRKYPNLPEYARTVHPYTDKNANGLTRMVIDWLQFSGHQAERIAVTGRYMDTSIVVTDILGSQRRIGSGRWIPPTMTPGTADISSTINGRSVKIEIKCKATHDRQSDAQKKYQSDVEMAGGVYVITRDFEGFMSWYKSNFMQ
jgi:hypothetical protein